MNKKYIKLLMEYGPIKGNGKVMTTINNTKIIIRYINFDGIFYSLANGGKEVHIPIDIKDIIEQQEVLDLWK